MADVHSLRRELSGHAGPINAVAVSPHGEFVLSASDDMTLSRWDCETGELLGTLRGHADSILDCAVGPDGLLLSASADGTLRLWETSSDIASRVLVGHADARPITGCGMSADASSIVSASADGTLSLWDRVGGELVRSWSTDSQLFDCAISPDGRFLVSAGSDGKLRLWDPATGCELARLVGHDSWISACAISPTGSFIVSSSGDRTLRLWDPRSGRELGTLEGHAGPILDCAVSPDETFVVSASADRSLRLWDPLTGTELAAMPGSRCCAVGPDGTVVSGGEDGIVKVWNTVERRPARSQDLVEAALEYESILRSAGEGVRDAEQARELRRRLETVTRSLSPPDEEASDEERATLADLRELADRGSERLHVLESELRVAAALEEYRSIARSAGEARDAEDVRVLRDRLQRLRRTLPAPGALAGEARVALDDLMQAVERNLGELASVPSAAPPSVAGGAVDLPAEDGALVAELPSPVGAREESLHAEPVEGLDHVDCTVFAPPSVCRGDSFLVQVFAHVPEQAGDARALATEFDAKATARGVTSLKTPVRRGAELGFELNMPGLDVEPRVSSLAWARRAQGVSFGVTVPSTHRLGDVLGRVAVSVDRLPVGQIIFKVEIAETGGPGASALVPAGDAHRYQLTFVSYARRDARKVSYCVQVMETHGVRFFQDVLHIPRGSRWEAELYRQIDRCDCFLLFWSKNAEKSEWTRKEVRRALERQGRDGLGHPAIEPVILDGPPVPTPWDELKELELDDSKIYRAPRRGLLARLLGR